MKLGISLLLFLSFNICLVFGSHPFIDSFSQIHVMHSTASLGFDPENKLGFSVNISLWIMKELSNHRQDDSDDRENGQ